MCDGSLHRCNHHRHRHHHHHRISLARPWGSNTKNRTRELIEWHNKVAFGVATLPSLLGAPGGCAMCWNWSLCKAGRVGWARLFFKSYCLDAMVPTVKLFLNNDYARWQSIWMVMRGGTHFKWLEWIDFPLKREEKEEPHPRPFVPHAKGDDEIFVYLEPRVERPGNQHGPTWIHQKKTALSFSAVFHGFYSSSLER